jgi:hypothetical protein
MASGDVRPHQQAEHMAAPTSTTNAQKTLAKWEQPTHGDTPPRGALPTASDVRGTPDVSLLESAEPPKSSEAALDIAASRVVIRRTQDLRGSIESASRVRSDLRQKSRTVQFVCCLPDLALILGDLKNELVAHRRAIIGVSANDDHERARASNNAARVILVEIGIIAVCAVVHNRQAIDDDTFTNDPVVNFCHRISSIVGSIAGDVDYLTRGDDIFVASQEQDGSKFKRAADGGTASKTTWCIANCVRKCRGGSSIVNDLPVDDELIVLGAREIEKRNRNPPQGPALNRLDDLRIEKRFRRALSFDPKLVIVHAA